MTILPLVRFGTSSDLTFVSRDGYLGPEVVSRKIDLHEVVVAEIDGQSVGYARIEYLWSKIPYLGLIWVRPDQRQRGVGKAILRFLEDFLRLGGHRAMYSSSQVDEAPPQAWHRHVGFEECGIIAGINDGAVGEVFFRKRL